MSMTTRRDSCGWADAEFIPIEFREYWCARKSEYKSPDQFVISTGYSTYSHLYRNITHFLWFFHFQGFTTIILVEGLLLNIFCFFYFYYHIIFIFTTYLNNITDFIPFPCVAGIPADVHSYMYQLSQARAGQSISNSSATAASATVLYSTLSNRLMIVCLSVS